MPRAPNIRVGEHYESLRAAFPMTIYFDYNNVLNSGGERCFHNRTFFLSMLSDFIALLRQGPMSVFSPQICLLSFAPSGHRRESVLRELDEADVIRAFHKIVFTMERTTGHDPSFPKETRILWDDPRIIKYSAGKDDYIASQGHLQSDLVFFVDDKFENLDAAIELLPTLYAIEMRLRRRHELNIGDRRGWESPRFYTVFNLGELYDILFCIFEYEWNCSDCDPEWIAHGWYCSVCNRTLGYISRRARTSLQVVCRVKDTDIRAAYPFLWILRTLIPGIWRR